MARNTNLLCLQYGGGEGSPRKKFVGGARPASLAAPKPLALTKICEISLPYLWPDQQFDSLFDWPFRRTQLPKYNLWRAFVDGLIDNASCNLFQLIPNSRLEYKNHTLFKTKMQGQMYTPFVTKRLGLNSILWDRTPHIPT